MATFDPYSDDSTAVTLGISDYVEILCGVLKRHEADRITDLYMIFEKSDRRTAVEFANVLVTEGILIKDFPSAGMFSVTAKGMRLLETDSVNRLLEDYYQDYIEDI